MKEQVQEISVRDLHSFRQHPFQVKDDESLQALCDSIREYGILSPHLARPTDEREENLTGNPNRRCATVSGSTASYRRCRLVPRKMALKSSQDTAGRPLRCVWGWTGFRYWYGI